MTQIIEYIKIALLNIKSNKGRSILTMLGIIIGISSVIMIITIGNGIKVGINDELNALAGGQVIIYSDDYDFEFSQEDIDELYQYVDHVKCVVSEYSRRSYLETGKGEERVAVDFGMPESNLLKPEKLIKGRYFTKREYEDAAQVCIITEKLARWLFGSTNVIGESFDCPVLWTTVELTVIGVRADAEVNPLVGMLEGNVKGNIELPYSVLFDQVGFSLGYGDLTLVSDGAQYTSQMAQDALKYLKNKYNVHDDETFIVQSFADVMKQVNTVLNLITTFVVMVAAISLLVGGIGVMNIMLVSVTERTREIGIRKALGARTGSILFQFLSESAIISLLGGVIGIILGILGAYGVCSIIDMKAVISWPAVIGASVFSSAVGIFFGLYPAKKAAQLSPIDALRHE